MSDTPVKTAPELAVSQASKEATVNEGLRRLEQGGDYYIIVDKDLSAPPGSCADGACYIVEGGSPTGDWGGHAGELAVAVGLNAANGWLFIEPREGTNAYAQDSGTEYRYDGAAWNLYLPGSGLLTLDDLTDVTTAGAADGDVLTYDATSPTGWSPIAPTAPSLSLNALTDVDVPAPSDGQVLTYDTASPAGWKAENPVTGVTTLDGLSDVDVPSPLDGQVLTYDTSSPAGWKAENPVTGATTLDGLSDVDAASPNDGDVLTYDTSSPNGWKAQAPFGAGGATLTESVPSAPAAGLELYAVNHGGLRLPAAVNVGGEKYDLQRRIATRQTRWAKPRNGSTTIDSMGFALTSGGSANRTVSLTSFPLQQRRIAFSTGAGAGSTTFLRDQSAEEWRGDAAGRGGFFFHTRVMVAHAAPVAGARAFFGFHSSTSAIGNVNPSSLASLIGMGYDSGDSNMQFMHNDGSGTATKIDLGASFPANTQSADIYDVEFYAAPNGSDVGYRITRYDTSGAPTVATGTLSSDLPANTTGLAVHLWMGNGATALAATFDLMGVWVESGF